MSSFAASVLIIDDNDVDRYLLRRRLNRVDPPVYIFEAQDATQALSFFNEWQSLGEEYREIQPPSIIFLDINMPIKNGLEFLDDFASVREQKEIDSVVVMCSTAKRPEEEARARSHEFVKEYFTKGQIDDACLKALILKYAKSAVAPVPTHLTGEVQRLTE